MPLGSKALVRGHELLSLLPPDSVVRRSQPPLRPLDVALLVTPLLPWLPAADQAALADHQPDAYAAAAKAHATGQAPRVAAAVAQVAALLSPPGPLHSAFHSAFSLGLALSSKGPFKWEGVY